MLNEQLRTLSEALDDALGSRMAASAPPPLVHVCVPPFVHTPHTPCLWPLLTLRGGRDFVIDVDFMRGGELLYTGTTIVSFVGILNGMRPGADGYSFSMDARCQGGKLWANLLESLIFGAMEPCQHARFVMENANNFEEAVHLFETGKIIDDGYFIIGGSEAGQGAVVTRARNHNVDTWRIDPEDKEHGWYRLETNYDHFDEVPTADDRRTPGFANMEAVGVDNMNEDSLLSEVMTQWPTFNSHTDLTCIMRPATGLYDCTVWLD